MAAGYFNRFDNCTFIFCFALSIWITAAGTTTTKLYPPRTLRPRAVDMFRYFQKQPFDGQADLVLQASGIDVRPQIEPTDLVRLRGLYNHLRDHPALMDSRLTASSRPDMETDQDVIAMSGTDDDNTTAREKGASKRVAKRRLELPLTESCPSVTEWISLNKSRDIHDNEVEVFQPNGSEEDSQLGAQFFYTTRCVHSVESQPCTGISFLYRSKCLTRKGYVMALVRKRPEDTFDWNWIQVPVSCNCGVSQKF